MIIKLDVTTQTEIEHDLKACLFEQVLKDHYDFVLKGFENIENLLY